MVERPEKSIADLRAAVVAFNTACSQIAATGLRVQVRVLVLHSMGSAETPFLKVELCEEL
jgi:hypothetical protein